jgi:hypothetical protein
MHSCESSQKNKFLSARTSTPITLAVKVAVKDPIIARFGAALNRMEMLPGLSLRLSSSADRKKISPGTLCARCQSALLWASVRRDHTTPRLLSRCLCVHGVFARADMIYLVSKEASLAGLRGACWLAGLGRGGCCRFDLGGLCDLVCRGGGTPVYAYMQE